MFTNRTSAGKLLAEKLKNHKNENAVVVAIPKGGVVVANEVAQELNLPLNVLPIQRIEYPGTTEYAVCAVDNERRVVHDEAMIKANPIWLKDMIARAQAEAERKYKIYSKWGEITKLKGKEVIIVDDGMLTALVMKLAISRVYAAGARKVIVAVPVSSRDALHEIYDLVDQITLLVPPDEFKGTIGAHYEFFPSISDMLVTNIVLNRGEKKHKPLPRFHHYKFADWEILTA